MPFEHHHHCGHHLRQCFLFVFVSVTCLSNTITDTITDTILIQKFSTLVQYVQEQPRVANTSSLVFLSGLATKDEEPYNCSDTVVCTFYDHVHVHHPNNRRFLLCRFGEEVSGPANAPAYPLSRQQKPHGNCALRLHQHPHRNRAEPTGRPRIAGVRDEMMTQSGRQPSQNPPV